MGRKIWVLAEGKTNSSGMTPTTVKTCPSRVNVSPRMLGSPPRCWCQKAWVMTATGSAPSQVSSEGIQRPMAGWMPRVSKKSPRTHRVVTISGRSPPVSVRDTVRFAPKVSNDLFISRQSRKLGIDKEMRNSVTGAKILGRTSSPGSCTGSGESSTALTMEKIAVLAPIPRAMVTIAIAANFGRFVNARREKRTSCQSEPIEVSG